MLYDLVIILIAVSFNGDAHENMRFNVLQNILCNDVCQEQQESTLQVRFTILFVEALSEGRYLKTMPTGTTLSTESVPF